MKACCICTHTRTVIYKLLSVRSYLPVHICIYVIDCQFSFTHLNPIHRGIFPISDKFRIVGLAEHGSSAQVDLQSDPEFASMFLFHNVEPLEMEGEREVILSKVGQLTVPVRTYIQVRILFLQYITHCTYIHT